MSTPLSEALITFAGFAALDLVYPEDTLAGPSTLRDLDAPIVYRPGGPPNAAAIGAAKLCASPNQVAIITALGGTREDPDDHGAILLRHMARTGLVTDGMSYMPDQVTTHVLVNNPQAGPNAGKRGFDVFHGTMAEFRANSIDYDALGNGAGRIFGLGSPGLLPGLEEGNGDGIRALLRRTKDKGFLNTVGTCYCDDGEGRRRLDAGLPFIDVLSTSKKELQQYTGETNPEKAAEYFHSAGVGSVLITLGPDGVYFSSKGGDKGRIPAFGNFDIKDRTGCGDLSWGALVYALSQGKSFGEAAELANKMGHYIAYRSEGALGAPDLATLDKWVATQTAN